MVKTFKTKVGKSNNGIDLGSFEGGRTFLNEVKNYKNVVPNNDITSLGLHHKNDPAKGVKLREKNLGWARRGALEKDLYQAELDIRYNNFTVRMVGAPWTKFDEPEVRSRLRDAGITDVVFENLNNFDVLLFILKGW